MLANFSMSTPDSLACYYGRVMAFTYRKPSLPISFVHLATIAGASLLTFGCADQGTPYTVVGGPFWTPLDFVDTVDLGHSVQMTPEAERIPPGPIELVDVTASAGLGAAIGGGNTHGVGISFADIDGDELPDIFVANGRNNRDGQQYASALYLNLGDGTFRNATIEAGILNALDGIDCYSVTAGDYDGDGDMDLYLGAQPTDILLENCGQVGAPCFVDVTDQVGAGGPPSDPAGVSNGKSKVVTFGDYDNDGDLDIASASKTLPAPRAYLLRNDGENGFTDVTAETGMKAHDDGNPCAIMWSDYDNDGDVDLQIWNDRGWHVLLRNQDGQTLEDVTRDSGLDAVQITNPMGIDAADIDHDGDLDYYVSNIGDNPLMLNDGDGTFTDITSSAGTGGEFGWGLAFEDLDHDTYADIFVAQEDNLPHLVFHNRATEPPTFTRIEVEHAQIQDSSEAHNVAVGFADYDRDGRVDVVAATTDGSGVQLYRNQTDTGSNHWLHVIVRPKDDPDGTPRPGSTDGIGARVGVMTGDLLQFRDITGGSSRASQNQLSVRFGLGDHDGADWIAVLWPSGDYYIVENVPGDQTLILPLAQASPTSRKSVEQMD